MTTRLSIQQHLAHVEGVNYEELQALTPYSERLEKEGEQNLAFLIRHCSTLDQYYTRFDAEAERFRDLIEALTDRAVTLDEYYVESPYLCGSYFFFLFFKPASNDAGEPRLIGEEVGTLIENLFAPFHRMINQVNDSSWFDLVSGGDTAKLRCEIWFLPALLAYLKLLREQKRELGQTSSPP